MSEPERTGFHLEVNSLDDLRVFLGMIGCKPLPDDTLRELIQQLKEKREGVQAALEAQQPGG